MLYNIFQSYRERRGEIMKTYRFYAAAFVIALLILSPSIIQGRDAERVGGNGVIIPSGSSTGTVSTSATTTGTVTTTTSSASSSYSSGTSNGYYGNYSFNLQETSFHNLGYYYSWSQYYSLLVSRYGLNPDYFNRFYRNSEPLITPELLKLTLREPLQLSERMLNSIDQLEGMLNDFPSGAESDKKALLDKSKEIRGFAKKIRKNQTLDMIDIRENKNLYKEKGKDSLDPEAINQLRELAVDLDRQLRELISADSTATISVESLQDHSLESLAKGIEKVCKSIEKSTKKM